eukprot:COSAG05_NODE_5359_length_1197_cov_5530.007286_2_plen_163_part_00
MFLRTTPSCRLKLTAPVRKPLFFLDADSVRLRCAVLAVTVQVKAAYTLQLLSRLANKLGIPEDHKIKLMYPDPDFGELCLLTSLAELEDESSVTIKLVDGGQANHSAVELQQLSEYQGFLKQVPLFAALNEREIVAIAEHLVEEVFADGHAIISEGHPGETM